MDMKKLMLILIANVSCFMIYAQSDPPKSEHVRNRNMGIEFLAGYSMPIGTYAGSDKNDKKSGYATGGFQAQFTFDWIGNKVLGIAFQYTYQRNPVSDAVSYAFPNGFPDSLSPGSWSNHFLMTGPVFMKTIKRLQVDAKILGGVIVSSSASFDTPDPADTLGITVTENIAAGFACQVSAGAGYAFSPHLAIKFNLNLLCGWPQKNKQYGSKFIGYRTYTDPETGVRYYDAVYTSPVKYEINKVVTTLNPSIGLVYRF